MRAHLCGFFAFIFCVFLGVNSVQANHIAESLTKTNISDFVMDITDRANNSATYDEDNIQSFFSNHLHPKSFFKSKMKYVIPGFPTQENSLFFDKQQYINSLIEAKDTISDFEADLVIKSIKIAGNKKKATIETVTHENAIMQVPQDGRTEYVPVTGRSTCTQVLTLSPNNFIQLYSAQCNTEMNFEGMF